MSKKIEWTEGSGNVFEDLGLENADELLAKSSLAHRILDIIQERGLSQAQAAKLLGTHQTQISRLKTGEGKDSMSFDLLLGWLTKLDINITLTMGQKRKNQKHGAIHVAA